MDNLWLECVVVDAAIRPEVLGEAERDLGLPPGEGCRALMRIDHQQVNGVGADVEHSQAHGCTLHGNGTDKNGADAKTAEARLREAVDRTLKPGDPVFQLLQKRLVDALATHLATHAPVRPQAAPELHAGRAPPGATR